MTMTTTATTPALRIVHVDGLKLAYRELGEGPPVLLLHGWPTSSFLWRRVMPAIAGAGRRVLAPDLPGFGESDKPLDIRYDFGFFDRILDGFLAAAGAGDAAVGLAVHDLGGPVGLHWAVERPARLEKLALLNTLVYPEFSEAVISFIRDLLEPVARERLTSPEGLTGVLREGFADPGTLAPQTLAAYLAPFAAPEARRALANAGVGPERRGFKRIAERLPALAVPVRIVYGARDRLLPDVADTMARVARDLPRAEVTVLPDRGHFIPEEAPEEVGPLLARFFSR